MNVVLKPKEMTEQEYFEYEEHSQIRHEYIDGTIYAMVGGSFNHARLVGNFARKIGNHLEGKKCEVFAESTKLKLPAQHKNSYYFYPDVVVKRHVYEQIPTLQEYIVVEQHQVEVTVYRRRIG